MARASAPETERERRLPEALVAPLRGSGLMLAGAPRRSAGSSWRPPWRCAARRRSPAATPPPAGACRSRSPAACSPPTCPDASRAELFGEPGRIAAGVWAPRGKARPVDGGVVVSGRWAFCSGITHADLLFAGCIVDGRRRRPPTPSVVAHPAGRARDPRHLAHARPARHGQPRRRRRRGVRPRRARVLAVRRPGRRPPALPLPGLRLLRALDRRGRAGQRARRDRRVRRAGRGQGRPWARRRTLAERSATHAAVAEAEASLRAARALYYEAIDAAWQAAQDDGAGPGRAAQRPAPGGHARGSHLRRRRPRRCTTSQAEPAIYDDSPLQRRFRDAHTATAHFQVNAASRELPGRILLGPARRHRDAVSRRVEGVLPFWLDRPDEEALDIALEVQRAGLGTLWIGELATFDAVALATAVGHRAAGPAAQDRPAGGRRAQPGCDRARRLVGGHPHRQRGRRSRSAPPAR